MVCRELSKTAGALKLVHSGDVHARDSVGDSELVDVALERCPDVATALVAASPFGDVDPLRPAAGRPNKTLLERALERSAFGFVEQLAIKSSLLADTQVTPSRTALETFVSFGATGAAVALVRKEGFDPMERGTDGRTAFERALEDCADRPGRVVLAKEMIDRSRVPPFAFLSTGRTVWERVLSTPETEVLAEALARTGAVSGFDRLDDGTTVFEHALSSGAHSVAAALVQSGSGVRADAIISTGITCFEAAVRARAAEVAKLLAQRDDFDPLCRTGDGRTFFEEAFSSGLAYLAIAIVASGKLPARSLLSDATTPFEHALRAKSKDVSLAALTAGSLAPDTQLPPHDKTCFEVALECGMKEIAYVMARFMGLDGLHVLSRGDTCFERAVPYGIAVAFVESGSVGPASRLPDGRTCLDYAVSHGAREVAQAIAQKI
eukprot:m51a1_g862 hypothetical protein (436) ;mRNA; r:807787-809536